MHQVYTEDDAYLYTRGIPVLKKTPDAKPKTQNYLCNLTLSACVL